MSKRRRNTPSRAKALGRRRSRGYPARMEHTPRAGFSIVEALVVLAISGMALAIIFSIGVKAGDTGFGLGRRAMSAADLDLAVSDLRTLLRSYEIRPVDMFVEGVDEPLIGAAGRLEGSAVVERATQCAPQGWAGRLILSIEGQGPRRVLTCRAGNHTAVLFELGATPARFTYSRDAATWTPTYENRRAPVRSEEAAKSQSVYIRFEAAPVTDVIEMASSGQPGKWVRNDLNF